MSKDNQHRGVVIRCGRRSVQCVAVERNPNRKDFSITAHALDAAGHVLLVASSEDGGTTLYDAHRAAYAVPALVGQPEALSASAGGAQDLFLRADAELAGDLYLIAGSLSGTALGFGFKVCRFRSIPTGAIRCCSSFSLKPAARAARADRP